MIAKATGMNLKVAPSLSDEVVTARLKDARVDITLSHLAESLCAKWEKHADDVTWLVPDLRAVNKLREANRIADEKHLYNSLKYIQKQLGVQPEELDEAAVAKSKAKREAVERKRKAAEAAEDYARMFAASSADEETPAWRAVARLMLQFDPKDLLEMPNKAREVWAEDPTPMQHPFSEEAQQVLKKYRQEQSLVTPESIPKRIKLVVVKWEEGSAMSANIEAVDQVGKQCEAAFVRLNDDSERMKIPFTERDKFDAKPGESVLAVPEEANQFRLALSNSYKGKDRPAILEKWRPRLLDPLKNEPTKFDVGQEFILAAEATDRNLIGTVTDMIEGNYRKPEKLTASQLLAKHAADFLPEADGWLVTVDHWRVQRDSRTKAKQLLDDTVKHGGITVDTAAEWVSQTTSLFPFTGWLGEYLHVLYSGSGPYSALSTTIDSNALRLWASLGSGVHDSLRHGDTVPLFKLSPESRSQIEKLIYWFQGLDEEQVDPTEKLPNGISDGTVSLTIKDTPVFYGWAAKDGPPAVPAPIDASLFGRFMAKGNTYWEIPAGVYQQYDRFKLGNNRAYELHFVINPGSVPMTIKLSETLFDPSTEPVDQLPDDLKAATEKARLAALSQPTKPKRKIVIPPK